MLCIILSGGIIIDYEDIKSLIASYVEPRQDTLPALVVCADSGLKHLEQLGLNAGLIVGDLDSADPRLLIKYKTASTDIALYPRNKDFSDTELSAEEAVKRGCSSILFLGALGGRFDHAMTNVLLMMKLAKRNIRAAIADDHNLMTAITGKLDIAPQDILSSFLGLPPAKPTAEITLDKTGLPAVSLNLSLMPLGGPALGITTEGMAYPLRDYAMEADYTTGVSNEITGATASVSLTSGCLLVTASRD
jgi:thiamine pyrophosphokinase